MPPVQRERILPTPLQFAAHTWLDRLVCSDAEQPRWKRTAIAPPVAHYEVECSDEDVVEVELDLSQAPPPPPAGLRLLSVSGYERFDAALKDGGQKKPSAALEHIDAALAAEPNEPLYRVARLSILYSMGSLLEALMEADALLKTHPLPVVWKFKALAARDLGLRSELFASLDGLIASTTPRTPLFAEAACARGLLRSDEDGPQAQAILDLEAGCRLGQTGCCQRLEEMKAAERAAETVVESQAEERATAENEASESALND